MEANSAELAMKATCVQYPVDYQLLYAREGRKLTATKLTISVKREIRNAYGDPSRADDAAPLAVYYTTDRAGYRLPRTLPTEIPRGQAAAYKGTASEIECLDRQETYTKLVYNIFPWKFPSPTKPSRRYAGRPSVQPKRWERNPPKSCNVA